jgi:hypothetical protein
MSIANTSDRSLVRRFKFLGFPGEKNGDALSYAALRAEMGDEHANALVVQVGVLAKVHHLDQFGIGIDGAVARIIQSLTPDERRTMAQGGNVPPRIEAMITAEAEAAKLQNKQVGDRQNNGKTDPSLAQPLAGFGMGAFAAWHGLSGHSDGGSSRSTASSSSAAYGQNMGSTSDPAFLHAVGISGGTAAALGHLGFKTREEVRQVVDDTRSLHLAPDKGAVVDVARLKKASGDRFEGHKQALQTYGDELRAARHEREEAEKETDPAKRAERLRHAEEMRRAAEQKQDQHRDHNTRTEQERRALEPVRVRVRKSVDAQDDLRNKAEREVGVEGARNLTKEQSEARLKPKAQQQLQQAEVQARGDTNERSKVPE